MKLKLQIDDHTFNARFEEEDKLLLALAILSHNLARKGVEDAFQDLHDTALQMGGMVVGDR